MRAKAGLVAAGAAGTLAIEVAVYVWVLRRVAQERLG
jgi:hypothetical protein